MVLPSSAPAPVAGEADWIDHLKVILRLADRSELILVDRARPTKLGELVRGLYQAYPDLRVYADATQLAGAPDKAVIVLEPKRTDAAWLNQERPLIANKQLKIILFCHEDTSAILAREAPDFFNWITHYVECPKGPYPVAVRALRRALCERWSCVQWTTDDLYETFSAALPGRELRHVSAGLPYGELVEAARQRGREWLVVTGVNSESSAERVTWALLEARRRARVILLGPSRYVDFRQSNTECVSLGAAIEVLERAICTPGISSRSGRSGGERAGGERAGLLAGLLELRGAAIKAAERCLKEARRYPPVREEVFRASVSVEPLAAIQRIGGSLGIPPEDPTMMKGAAGLLRQALAEAEGGPEALRVAIVARDWTAALQRVNASLHPDVAEHWKGLAASEPATHRPLEPATRGGLAADADREGLRTVVFSAAEDCRNARYESAAEKLERVLAELDDGKSSPGVVRGEVLLLLARSLQERRAYKQAAIHLFAALSEMERVSGKDSVQAGAASWMLAETLVELKRFPEAESNARRALEIAEASRLSDEECVSISEILARALSKQGKLADAERVLRLAWIRSAALPDPVLRDLIKARLAAILRAEGKWDEAELLFSDPGHPHS